MYNFLRSFFTFFFISFLSFFSIFPSQAMEDIDPQVLTKMTKKKKRFFHIIEPNTKNKKLLTEKRIIDDIEFEKFNSQFNEIDKIGGPPEFALIGHEPFRNECSRQLRGDFAFFSILEEEGINVRGKNNGDFCPYLITGGVKNCVAVSLYGKNDNGDFFSSLFHISRSNPLEKLEESLNELSSYKEKTITVRSSFKSENLLRVFNFLKEKGHIISSVYVNPIGCWIEDGTSYSLYKTDFFDNQSEKDFSSKPMIEIFSPVALKTMFPSYIMVQSVDGNIYDVHDAVDLENFEKLSIMLRKAKNPKDFSSETVVVDLFHLGNLEYSKKCK